MAYDGCDTRRRCFSNQVGIRSNSHLWWCVLQQMHDLCDRHWLGVTKKWHFSADNDWWIGRKSGCPRTIDFASKERGEVVG